MIRRALGSTRYIFLASGIILALWSMVLVIFPTYRISPDFVSPCPSFGRSPHTKAMPLSFANDSESDLDAYQDTTTIRSFSSLGIASQIYMISLPGRQDRRAQMDVLRSTMQIEWTNVDAVHREGPLVDIIMNHVRMQRKRTAYFAPPTIFRWPPEINALSLSPEALDKSGSDLWTESPKSKSRPTDTKAVSRGRRPSLKSQSEFSTLDWNLTCATEDYMVLPFSESIHPHMVLSAPKVACWYSHVSAIRKFTDQENAKNNDVAIILEDDIDMERDIRERLSGTWDALPPGWDIVFLGHCWSNESFYPPLPSSSFRLSVNTTNAIKYPQTDRVTRLHNSFAPKCTHAYALSRSGARRLLLHLRYPPFAYSRALDQAISWLVESGRLRSYSIVPSVVVQRKVVGSDVMEGVGSTWKEGLVYGVFGS